MRNSLLMFNCFLSIYLLHDRNVKQTATKIFYCYNNKVNKSNGLFMAVSSSEHILERTQKALERQVELIR